MNKHHILFIIISVFITSCGNNEKRKLDISELDKTNLILIEDLYSKNQIENLISENEIEYSKTQDFSDNCYVYNYSNQFFSEKNQLRGAISSDTYEYYSKEKKDIHKFFNDSLNRNRGFETFKYNLTDDFIIDSDLYAVHKVMDGDKLIGYEIAVVISNKLIRSSIVLVNALEFDTKQLNKKLNRIKTMPNTVYN